jgi:hypothetical protein
MHETGQEDLRDENHHGGTHVLGKNVAKSGESYQGCGWSETLFRLETQPHQQRRHDARNNQTVEPSLRDDRDLMQRDTPLRSMHIPQLPTEHEAEEDRLTVVRQSIDWLLVCDGWVQIRHCGPMPGASKHLTHFEGFLLAGSLRLSSTTLLTMDQNSSSETRP